MRHVRMLGLCLVAVLAVAAMSASSALAGPQWVKCENVGSGGNYTGPNCTKAEKAKPKGTGNYELFKAPEVEAKRLAEGKSPGVPFSGGSVGGEPVLTTILTECTGGTYAYQRVPRSQCTENGGEINGEGSEAAELPCTGETNTGETSSKNGLANVKVTFTGCALFGFLPCHSEGAEEGEVNVNTLKGKLGWINKSAKEVGVLLEPAAKHGKFADFECSATFAIGVGVGNKHEGTWYQGPEGEEKHGGYDGIISPITPINTTTTEYEQVFKVNYVTGENIPGKFEGKHIELLEDYLENIEEEPPLSSMWDPAGEELTNVNVSEEPGEIKA